MAEKTGPAAVPKAKKKGGGLKLIIMAVVAVLVLGAGGYFAYSKFLKKPAEAAEGGEEGVEGEGGEAKPAVPPTIRVEEEPKMAVLSLEPFLVNLTDPDAQRFLRCTMRLAIDTKEHMEVLGKNDAVLVKIRNDFLDIMSTKTGEELVTVEGKQKLRKELLQRANQVMGKDWAIDLLYTDFVVQM